jgi:hypothetical protein
LYNFCVRICAINFPIFAEFLSHNWTL